ncbi:sigma-70 family RNA polymerase sigma factor [Cupriavidus basilensis]|uniref:RNA polymerase sigma factor n=1 Tax=Cupriavidus basilensis TaxID=68895 RepID=A0ABT6AIP1_9BURK|nr:sigma-70 family RNA polymerase sigma factor [Cupriavidus basilensis]MDF3832470.1 sigma-70 family RNA polymerase sigma factor [Cupriavidus basilensis]
MLDEHYLSQFPALRARLVRMATRMLGGRADAEDVVQDTYLRALEAGDKPELAATQAWLTTVMRNLAIDQLRRDNWMQRWLCNAEAQAIATEAPSAEADAAQAESIERALRLLASRLAPADGAAVLLREVFEASFREIAEGSGKTEAGCRQQLHRALLRLRQAQGGHRSAEEAESEAVFHLYRQALRDCDPRALFAILRQPPTRALGGPASAAVQPESQRTTCQVMQIGGRLALVLALGGKVLCVLPLGTQQTHCALEAAPD